MRSRIVSMRDSWDAVSGGLASRPVTVASVRLVLSFLVGAPDGGPAGHRSLVLTGKHPAERGSRQFRRSDPRS